MSTPALCTTGRRARGASASKTRPSRPPTPQQAGCEVTTPPARWACRLARSSVSESTWAKFLPKSMSFFDFACVSISTTLLMFPFVEVAAAGAPALTLQSPGGTAALSGAWRGLG